MSVYNKFNSPKNVAFDIGDVLFHFNPDPLINILLELNITEDKQTACDFIGGNFQHLQEIGLYTLSQSFFQLNKQLSQENLQAITEKWRETFIPSLPMIDLVTELVNNDYNVALLSNIGPDHAKLVREVCPIFNNCLQHFSCEIGARKPSLLFFQSFSLQYGWGKLSKYFDDREDNIKVGTKFYSSTLFNLKFFNSDEEAAAQMRKYIYNDV
jgi:FMN phosphatase YigB (HAD superfamily)